MAIEVLREDDTDIKDVICEWVQERIDSGDSESDAARYVLHRLRAEGLMDRVVDRFGPRMIADVWHGYSVAPARDTMWRVARGPKPAAPESGARRVDLSLLRDEASVMEALYQVDGEWVRLGDMVKHQCRTLADRYSQLTENSQRKADFFDQLATKLPKDKSVRVAFSEAQVRAMLEELGA